MAERIVSPGVFTRENDLSFLQEGVGAIGAAVVGPFKEGPAFVPQVINTQNEFERKFGRSDGTYYSDITVQNYLREAGTVTVVRIGGLGGYTQANPVKLVASGSVIGQRVIASWFDTNEDAFGADATAYNFRTGSTADEFLFDYPSGSGGVTASIDPKNSNDIGAILGSSAQGSKSIYNYVFFENTAAEVVSSGSYTLSLQDMPNNDFLQDITNAYTPVVTGNTGDELFRFHTLSDGTSTNTKFKVGITNIRPPAISSGTDYATFNVVVREYGDTDRRPVVLETYSDVTLDPESPNFISRIIGNRTRRIDSDGKITETGDWPTQSEYIRVEVITENVNAGGSTPLGHSQYYNPIDTNNPGWVPAVTFSTASVDNTAGSDRFFSGFDFETADERIDNRQYLQPLPDTPETGSNVPFSLETYVTSSIFQDLIATNDPDRRSLARNKAQFVLAFQGGFDGKSPAIENLKGSDITAVNSQGFDLSLGASGYNAYQRAINALSNADEWDINLVVAPGVIRRLHTALFDQFIDLVDVRQDAFFIGEVVGAGDTISQAIAQAESVDSSYSGTYYPWVKTLDNRTNRQITVPPSVLLPAIYAANDRIAAEWFAPAGLNRGGLIGAVGVENRLTQGDRDDLYEAKVNPIASFPGQGIVAWGQKTLQEASSALDRINVRRLLIVAKKFIASTSRFLVFEQNTATTRARFVNTVNPFLESIQQRQGLFAFRVVMDESNNTPDVVDRNQLVGSIFLQPTRTAEFIIIDFNVLPTGATFDV